MVGEWVYRVWDILLDEFMAHNFVSGLRTLKPKNVWKTKNLKTFLKPRFFQPWGKLAVLLTEVDNLSCIGITSIQSHNFATVLLRFRNLTDAIRRTLQWRYSSRSKTVNEGTRDGPVCPVSNLGRYRPITRTYRWCTRIPSYLGQLSRDVPRPPRGRSKISLLAFAPSFQQIQQRIAK